MPLLVGAVEFGSFTRCPRLGNPGIVLWRDEATRSTQNRVGLKNPGALAAAEFLARASRPAAACLWHQHCRQPRRDRSRSRMCREVLESLAAFLDRGVRPSWFTLNLSCPNTEDDPGSHQTEARARDLCAAVTGYLAAVQYSAVGQNQPRPRR